MLGEMAGLGWCRSTTHLPSMRPPANAGGNLKRLKMGIQSKKPSMRPPANAGGNLPAGLSISRLMEPSMRPPANAGGNL